MDDIERARHRRIAARKVEGLREAARSFESLLALQRDEERRQAESAASNDDPSERTAGAEGAALAAVKAGEATGANVEEPTSASADPSPSLAQPPGRRAAPSPPRRA
jgi:hypothetical protein